MTEETKKLRTQVLGQKLTTTKKQSLIFVGSFRNEWNKIIYKPTYQRACAFIKNQIGTMGINWCGLAQAPVIRKSSTNKGRVPK